MDSSAPLEPTFSAPDGEFTIFCREHVLVLIPATDGAFGALRQFIQKRAAETGGPVSMLVLVRPGVRADAAHLRTEVNSMVSDLEDEIACMAVAIDGRGFFASTFMSMASGLFMHTRHSSTPLRVFSGTESACAWLQEGSPAPWLPGLIEAVRAAVDSPAAPGR